MRNYLINYQGWNDNNIEVKINSDATASAITSYISSMPNTRGTTELFTYAGHGSTSGLCTYSGTVSPSNILTSFGNNFHQFGLFIKACYSGVFTEQMDRGEISTTCSSSQFSFSDPGQNGRNSAYFGYVLDGIKNNAADPLPGHVLSISGNHGSFRG